jgi:hypothetical protein
VTEAFDVYRRGAQTEVRGRITGTVEYADADASAAIQRALDLAGRQGGGAVLLQPGVYLLHRPLRLRSRVTLHGSGRSTALRLAPDHETGTAVIGETIDGATVADLTLDGDREHCASSQAGVVLDECGDCRLRNVAAARFGRYGIWARHDTFLSTVEGCVVADNAISGILMDAQTRGRGGDWTPNHVIGCTVYGGGTGIETNNAVVLNIVGCTVYHPGNHAYHLHTRSNSVLISGCRSFECWGNAVLVEESHEVNVSSNIFCWHHGHGIELANVQWGTIAGNNVIDTGAQSDEDAPPAYGILLRGGTRGLQVTGNAIFNWGGRHPARLMAAGIHETADCAMNALAANNVNYAAAAVESAGDGTLVTDIVHREAAYRNGAPTYSMERLQAFLAALYDTPAGG